MRFVHFEMEICLKTRKILFTFPKERIRNDPLSFHCVISADAHSLARQHKSASSGVHCLTHEEFGAFVTVVTLNESFQRGGYDNKLFKSVVLCTNYENSPLFWKMKHFSANFLWYVPAQVYPHRLDSLGMSSRSTNPSSFISSIKTNSCIGRLYIVCFPFFF